MIAALFFDFDGVLTTDFSGSETICKNLCKAAPGLSIRDVMECYRKHCGCLLLGHGKYVEVWDSCCACIGQKIAPDILREALRRAPRNEQMFALALSLREKYRLGIITDNPEERIDLLKEDMRLPDLFNPIVVSASVHALKHDGTTTIFDTALAAANCKPEQSIFIDNQQRNLITPSKMGMKVYLHDDARNDMPSLLSTLHKWGVAPEKQPNV